MVDMMKQEITRNLLKYAAGSQIMCPGCDRILDWKRTAIVEAHQGDKTVHSLTCCTSCLDKRMGELKRRIDSMNASMNVAGLEATCLYLQAVSS